MALQERGWGGAGGGGHWMSLVQDRV
jgi:hypothetical protein